MFAFFDSPIQLMVLLVVLLIVFGPQKLPEIGQQLGKALRDLRKATQEFSNTMSLDDHNSYNNNYNSSYEPPRYDSYGNIHEDQNRASIPEEDVWQPPTPENKAISALSSSDPPHGDFAAAALSDASTDYGVGLSPSAPAPESAPSAPPTGAAYPEGVVPRSKT